MNLGLVAGVVRRRRELRARERWPQARLEEHRAAALAALRGHAYARSPFYRRFHAGYESRPLGELPVLTKGQLMEAFDDLVTDRELRLRSMFPRSTPRSALRW
jgi:phenylacetate-coenzyme A ligase PaaK-like adenylate-forming protein